MTKKIYLFPRNTLPDNVLSILDVSKLNEIGEWLAALPPTKRGGIAYKMVTGSRKIPAIIFVRHTDANAFRLKFGL